MHDETRVPRKPISKNVVWYHRDGIRDRGARGRGTGISALYLIAGAHTTADTPVGRSRSETQVAHYAAVKPDNRSVGGDGGGGGGGGVAVVPTTIAVAATVAAATAAHAPAQIN